MTISHCHAPAFGSYLVFGRRLLCRSHKNPPRLGQFGNVWGNRGRKLDEEGKKKKSVLLKHP